MKGWAVPSIRAFFRFRSLWILVAVRATAVLLSRASYEASFICFVVRIPNNDEQNHTSIYHLKTRLFLSETYFVATSVMEGANDVKK